MVYVHRTSINIGLAKSQFGIHSKELIILITKTKYKNYILTFIN